MADLGGWRPHALVRPGADLEPIHRILERQNPNLRIAAPILLAQGGSDTTVLPFLTDQLDSELRARTNRVRYLTYPDVEHVGIVAAPDRPTRRFFRARLK